MFQMRIKLSLNSWSHKRHTKQPTRIADDSVSNTAVSPNYIGPHPAKSTRGIRPTTFLNNLYVCHCVFIQHVVDHKQSNRAKQECGTPPNNSSEPHGPCIIEPRGRGQRRGDQTKYLKKFMINLKPIEPNINHKPFRLAGAIKRIRTARTDAHSRYKGP
jgi:hypothetical protein